MPMAAGTAPDGTDASQAPPPNDVPEPKQAQAAFSGFDFGLTTSASQADKDAGGHGQARDASQPSHANYPQPSMTHQEAESSSVPNDKGKRQSTGGREGTPAITAPLTHPNGTELFPAMPASEQETISQEALNQAEASIVADNDELEAAGETSSDGGYESDVHNEGTSSISSSVRDYMYENGRRYHRFREGQYNFPNDDPEQEREDMKHAMMKLLCKQKLHFAPIGENPQEILDMGTGTGIWAIESRLVTAPRMQQQVANISLKTSGRFV